MPIETFTREQFEQALPRHKRTGQPLWRHLGLTQGEHTYRVAFGSAAAEIEVRSSVRDTPAPSVAGTVTMASVAAPCGQDSIRAWLINPADGRPLGSKAKSHIARTKNWRDNLLDLLRRLARVGLAVGPCPKCGLTLRVHKCTKGPRRGQLFLSCPARVDGRWLDHYSRWPEDQP